MVNSSINADVVVVDLLHPVLRTAAVDVEPEYRDAEMPRVVEEVLYPALEDFKLDVVLGKGPSARSIRLDLPRFTLVGATTRAGLATRSSASARVICSVRMRLEKCARRLSKPKRVGSQ